MHETKALRQQRAKILTDAQAILQAETVTEEDQAKAYAMIDEADAMLKRIEALERIAALDLAAGIGAASADTRQTQSAPDFNAQAEADIFRAMVNGGERVVGLPQAQQDYFAASVAREVRVIRAMMTGAVASLSDADQAHYRTRFVAAAATSPDTVGGYTIAPVVEAAILVAMKLQGGMRAAARVIQSSTGAPWSFPTLDDLSVKAYIVGGENVSLGSGTDLTFGKRQLGAFTYTTGIIPVSWQLLQDSMFDFDTLLRDAISGRFERGQNAHFTTGTGVGQPRGVVTAAPSGGTALTTGQSGAVVVYEDLIELEHSVDPVYRRDAVWMFNDSTLKALRKLKETTTGRPLWLPALSGIAPGAPDTLLGYRYVINQDMPNLALNSKSIAFGNFQNYVIRDVVGMQIRVLNERYAENAQVAWISYARTDGDLLSAASPIKVLTQPGS